MNNEKILVFKLGGEQYATNIIKVERILGYQKPTLLPDADDYVEGVIDYGDGILPVINLCTKFKIPKVQKTDQTKIIVVKDREFKIGIEVDSVSEVIDITDDQIEDVPSITKGASRNYIEGLVKKDTNIIILLNIYNILTSEEKQKINRTEI